MNAFRFTAFLLLALLPSGARGEAGAAAYLGDASGARWKGMGGAGRAAVSDVGAIYLNPSCLTIQGPVRWQLGTGYGLAGAGRSAFSLAFSAQTDRSGTFAFGWIRHEVNDLERVDFSGNVVGADSNVEDALTAGFGIPLTYRIRLGAAVRYLHQTLFDFAANGATFDAGVLFQPWLSREIFAGLVAQNVVGSFEWSTGRRDRPARAVAGGLAYYLRDKALFVVDLVSRENVAGVEYHLGAEYWALPEIAVRAGLDDGWPAAGATYSWQVYELDYGFRLDDTGLGDIHRFSFILRL